LLRELFRINDSLDAIKRSTTSIERQLADHHNFAVIRHLDFELVHHPRYSDAKRLQRYGFQACSQNYEDGIIHEIFKRVGVADRFFVEIGVGNGNQNNTAFLVSQGWRGHWIDGNADFLATIERRGWNKDGLVTGMAAMVSHENVSSLLTDAGVPKTFDLLSIDVDQNTYHIWSALHEFQPRVVVVEFNAAFPPELEWVVPYNPSATWNGSQNFGASLKSFQRLGEKFGYNLVGCDFVGVNAFFVKAELCGTLFASPFTSDNHYEPLRYSALMRRGHPQEAFSQYIRND
jgi:hypothetical protein